MKTKRRRTSGRNKGDGRDRLSELPDDVLLHIVEFMDTIYAVRTCVLSKRWKNLWKCLTTLSFSRWHFRTIVNYNKFVSRVLSDRDGSFSLLNLDFEAYDSTAPKLLNKATQHVMLHNVSRLTIHIDLYSSIMLDHSMTLIFSCPSLTFLKLSISSVGHTLELPKPLHLPALKSLHIENVGFTASDNDCVDPFSTCNLLNTLVLRNCSFRGAKVLAIYNSSLSSLNLESSFLLGQEAYEIVLSTPNLTSLTIMNHFSYHQLSSACNLSFLEEVNIDTCSYIDYSVAISWLRLLTNVKILTLSMHVIKKILNDLSNLSTMRTQPPRFVRLESLKVKWNTYPKLSKEEVNMTVKYLLQNSQLTKVDVINC